MSPFMRVDSHCPLSQFSPASVLSGHHCLAWLWADFLFFEWPLCCTRFNGHFAVVSGVMQLLPMHWQGHLPSLTIHITKNCHQPCLLSAGYNHLQLALSLNLLECTTWFCQSNLDHAVMLLAATWALCARVGMGYLPVDVLDLFDCAWWLGVAVGVVCAFMFRCNGRALFTLWRPQECQVAASFSHWGSRLV